MSEEDYVRLLNLSNRLKKDSASNNQGDEDQGLNKREGEEGEEYEETKQSEAPQTPFQQSLARMRGASASLSRGPPPTLDFDG